MKNSILNSVYALAKSTLATFVYAPMKSAVAKPLDARAKRPLAAILTLAFLCAGVSGVCLSSAPSQAQSAVSIVDVSGAWTSQYGTLTLKVEGKDNDGHVVVSGALDNSGTISEVIYGRFFPATAGGVLKIEYFVPGRKTYGYAEFKLSANKTVFNGNYNEADQRGEWVLSRNKGYAPKYLNSLPTVTNLGRNKHSSVLTNIAGQWESTFGLVDIVTTGYSRGALFKGKFTRPDGKVGNIDSGTYIRDSKGGLIKLQYTTAWNNTKGTGTFRPDPFIPDRQLLGVYEENGQTGAWILSRPFPR